MWREGKTHKKSDLKSTEFLGKEHNKRQRSENQHRSEARERAQSRRSDISYDNK